MPSTTSRSRTSRSGLPSTFTWDGIGTMVSPWEPSVMASTRAGLHHVEGQTLGLVLDDVGHHHLVGDVGLGDALYERRPVEAGAHDGDLQNCSFRTPPRTLDSMKKGTTGQAREHMNAPPEKV